MLCGYNIDALLLDEAIVDLYACASLEGQIDGLTTDFAHPWLSMKSSDLGSKRYPDCYPKR